MNSSNSRYTKDQEQAILEKRQEAEKKHKLVIKIISWRSGLVEGASIQSDNKISVLEWDEYSEYMLKISNVEHIEKTKDRLNKTHLEITNNNGFEVIPL